MDIAVNIAHIREKMEKAAALAGRDPGSIVLVAVSKMQPEERIKAGLAAGQRVFGENRVQEAKKRWAAHKGHYPDLALHLIGPLQTNKTKDAVALFDVIETVDRFALADALAQEMKRQKRILRCFIQVNTGAEKQKSGVAPENLPDLLEHCRAIGLEICGLMCLPPVDEPPALHFALLRKLAQRYGLPELSMGMSADFEKAIALGSTSVRVGTALFGERQPEDQR